MKWGDIVHSYDEERKREYLQWTTERGTKTRTGADENEARRVFQPLVWQSFTDRCIVYYYKQYKERRPAEANTPDASFFYPSIAQKVLA